ncbi:hypothetical protein SteCoe_2763 [Stentor coeruleus]|uniref:Uncharacterized protein n=1 Tax=Stentor coeruleus TaxID=5963 RepID=A0A1R2CYR1_9CILI|nr:hypothetical protein SteCoe_2763 [Stentor coeruleus]
MNKRIKKYRSDANLGEVKLSPKATRKHKSFLLPQIRDGNMLTTSRQSLLPELQKNSKSKKSKSENNSPRSKDSTSPFGFSDTFSQTAITNTLSNFPEKSNSTSNLEFTDSIIPSLKESYKFKVTAAAIEEDHFIYNLKFNKEKTNKNTPDQEKNSFEKCENETLCEQLSSSLIKYEHLEEAYITDTNMLKKEIEKYKQKYKQNKVNHKILIQRYETLNKKHNEITEKIEKNKEFYTNEIKKLSKEVENLQNELNFKSSQIADLHEYCDNIKKENEDKIISLQRKLITMEFDAQKQENIIKTLKASITATNVLYEEQKTKCENYIKNLDEMQNLKEDNLKLQIKLGNTQSILEYAIEERKNISQIHAEQIRKNIEIEKKIKNKERNISNEGINYQTKFSRTKTLRYFNISNGISENQDEVYEKMLRSIDILKEEIKEYKEDNEKNCKDLEYARKNIEEKCAQIKMMEKKFKEDVDKEVNNCREAVLKSIVKLMDKYQKKLDYIKIHTDIMKTRKNIGNMSDNESFDKIIMDCLNALEGEYEVFTEYINEFNNEFILIEGKD